MPFEQPITAVNPGLAIEGIDQYKFTKDPVDAVERAYKAGIVNFNDLMDAGIVRPAQRQEERETALDTASSKKQSREQREAVRATGLDIQTAKDTAEMQAAQARMGKTIGIAGADYMTPERAAELAKLGGSTQISTGQLALQKARTELDEINKDPYKSKAPLVGWLNKYGVAATIDEPVEALVKKSGDTMDRLAKSAQDHEMLIKGMDVVAKQGEINRALTSTLATDVAGNKQVQAYETALQNGQNLLRLADSSPNGMVDLAMINQFNKVLDPTGTVREGEQKLTTSAISALQRWGLSNGMSQETIDQIAQRFTLGTKLTPETRKAMADIVSGALASHKQIAIGSVTPVINRANDNNIPLGHILPKSLTEDVTPGTAGTAGSASGASKAPATGAIGTTTIRSVMNPATGQVEDVEVVMLIDPMTKQPRLYRKSDVDAAKSRAQTKPPVSVKVLTSADPAVAANMIREGYPKERWHEILDSIPDSQVIKKISKELFPPPEPPASAPSGLTVSPSSGSSPL